MDRRIETRSNTMLLTCRDPGRWTLAIGKKGLVNVVEADLTVLLSKADLIALGTALAVEGGWLNDACK